MKNKAPLIAAVVLGLVAVLAIGKFLSANEDDGEPVGKKVMVVKRELAPGTELDETMLGGKNYPPAFLPASYIPASQANAEMLIGMTTRGKMKKGQLITMNDLEEIAPGGFEALIPAGERAFTVNISGGTKGGLVRSSDHVDILATIAVPMVDKGSDATAAAWRQRSDMVTMVLLQNVTVLDVGGDVAPGGASSPNEFTLATTLEEAELLAFASQHGELAAVLRKQEDDGTVPREDLPRVTFEQLEKIVGSLDSERSSRVRITKGGVTTEFSVQD